MEKEKGIGLKYRLRFMAKPDESSRLMVRKASGELVAFDAAKLRRSLRRSGAGCEHADAIVRSVSAQLTEGMATKKIYRLAHKMLRKETRHTAARYSLKQALLGLGPSGYPFERFVGKLFAAEGFDVQNGLLLAGKCVPHEIDVLAKAGGRLILGECKFHNRQHLVCDVKIPLYIRSRFEDLRYGFLKESEWENTAAEFWIFTNTRFTEEALRYGHCAGLHLIGWDTPSDYGLRDWVDRTGLHPLTCLTTLTQQEKNTLLGHDVVLARELLPEPGPLQTLNLSFDRVKHIRDEAEQLCFSKPEEVMEEGQ